MRRHRAWDEFLQEAAHVMRTTGRQTAGQANIGND